MKPRLEVPLWVGVVVPLVLAVLLGLSVRPVAFERVLLQARLATEANHPETAAHLLEEAADMYPWRTDLLHKAGQAAYAGGDMQMAIRIFERLKGMDALDEEERALLAEAYLESGNRQQAAAEWRTLVEQKPTADLLRRLVLMEREMGAYTLAKADLEMLLNLRPEDGWALYQLGLLRTLDVAEEAIRLLERASTVASEYEAAYRILAPILRTSGRVGEPAYDLLLIGRALGTLGEWDLALAAFNQAITYRPDYAEAWAFLSLAKQQLGLDGAAEMQKALALGEDSVVVQALAAAVLEGKSQEETLAHLQAAQRLEPENPLWLVQIGRVYEGDGDLMTALGFYQQAAEMAPEHVLAWKAIASLAVYHGFQVRQVGLPAARQAVAIAPEDAESLDLMGQVMYTLEDLASAERFYLRALQVDNGYYPANFHLGLLYRQQGKYSAARAQLERAMQMGGDSPVGQAAAEALKTLPNTNIE